MQLGQCSRTGKRQSLFYNAAMRCGSRHVPVAMVTGSEASDYCPICTAGLTALALLAAAAAAIAAADAAAELDSVAPACTMPRIISCKQHTHRWSVSRLDQGQIKKHTL